MIAGTSAMKGPTNPERAFGRTVGTVLIVIGAYAWWRARPALAVACTSAGLVLVLVGTVAPWLLRWPSALWWRLALAVGYVNTRLLLALAFLLVLTPTGLMWRAIGRDPLGQRRRSWPGWTPWPPRYRDRSHYARMY